jgi:cysteine/O-acetylserine efflux protein
VEKSASFLKGFLLQFVNVKIYLFGITALTGYVTEYSASLWVLLLFEIIIATIGTIATLTWIGMGVLIQRAYQKYYRVINIILALTLSECVYSMLK